jgi:drug/metabolite transporter (DMT)-like permease
VAAYVYLQPLVTGTVAPLVLTGEGLTPRSAVAGVLIFAGLASVITGEYRDQGIGVGPVVGE